MRKYFTRIGHFFSACILTTLDFVQTKKRWIKKNIYGIRALWWFKKNSSLSNSPLDLRIQALFTKLNKGKLGENEIAELTELLTISFNQNIHLKTKLIFLHERQDEMLQLLAKRAVFKL